MSDEEYRLSLVDKACQTEADSDETDEDLTADEDTGNSHMGNGGAAAGAVGNGGAKRKRNLSGKKGGKCTLQ